MKLKTDLKKDVTSETNQHYTCCLFSYQPSSTMSKYMTWISQPDGTERAE